MTQHKKDKIRCKTLSIELYKEKKLLKNLHERKKKSCWKSKQIYILWNFKEKNYVTKKKRYLIINLVHQLTVKLKEKSARQTPKLLADDAIEWRSEKSFYLSHLVGMTDLNALFSSVNDCWARGLLGLELN